MLSVCWFLLTIQRACRSVVKRAALSLYLIGTPARYTLTLSVIESNYGEKWVASIERGYRVTKMVKLMREGLQGSMHRPRGRGKKKKRDEGMHDVSMESK